MHRALPILAYAALVLTLLWLGARHTSIPAEPESYDNEPPEHCTLNPEPTP